MNRQPEAERGLSAVATTAHRLGVLLSAGATPNSAWRYLDASNVPLVARVAKAVTDGMPVPLAILAELPASGDLQSGAGMTLNESQAWRSLAAGWRVATAAGAPLASSLRTMAGSLRTLAESEREVQIALAGPVATARMVLVLPVVAVGLGILLGFNPLRTLFTTSFGFACLSLGIVLIGVAVRWNRRLVASAQPKDVNPGLLCELAAIAVSGGASVSRARMSVELALSDCGLVLGADDAEVAERIIALSARAGVPVAELLRAEAQELRRLARASSAQQAEILSVRLILPLGLCILPAFMVLGVAPVVLALLSSTVIGL
jgi:tight adherence protein B